MRRQPSQQEEVRRVLRRVDHDHVRPGVECADSGVRPGGRATGGDVVDRRVQPVEHVDKSVSCLTEGGGRQPRNDEERNESVAIDDSAIGLDTVEVDPFPTAERAADRRRSRTGSRRTGRHTRTIRRSGRCDPRDAPSLRAQRCAATWRASARGAWYRSGPRRRCTRSCSSGAHVRAGRGGADRFRRRPRRAGRGVWCWMSHVDPPENT